jgi:hypothetical protein
LPGFLFYAFSLYILDAERDDVLSSVQDGPE